MNIVLLIVDSLNKKESKFIEGLFDVVYQNHYATSKWTLPALHTIFLGTNKHPSMEYTSRCFTGEVEPGVEYYLGHEPLPRFFQEEGITTRALTGGGWASEMAGLDYGFDDFKKVTDDHTATNLGPISGNNTFWFKHTYFMHQFEYDVEDGRGKLKACQQNRNEGWDKPEIKRYRKELYRAYIKRAKKLPEILAWVKKTNDIVILTSDHGLSFEDRGSFAHGVNAQLSTIAHVPLMVKCPKLNKTVVKEKTYDYQLFDMIKEFYQHRAFAFSLQAYRNFYNKDYWPYWEDPNEDYKDVPNMLTIYPRLEWIALQLKEKNCKTVLDTGCGPGNIAIPLARLGYEVAGIDVSSYIIQVAKGKAKLFEAPVSFKTSAIEQFQPKQKYDAVLCFAVIEHVLDIEALMDSLESFVEPENGTIFMTFPTENGSKKGHTRGGYSVEEAKKLLESRNSRNIFCQLSGTMDTFIWASYQLK